VIGECSYVEVILRESDNN